MKHKGQISRRLMLMQSAICLAGCAAPARDFISVLPEGACDTVVVDMDRLRPGEFADLNWCGLPILVRHRTDAEIRDMRAVDISTLRDPARDQDRFPDPHWFVAINQCTHLGCKVIAQNRAGFNWQCVCHGSVYDASGRILRGPARRNLPIPPFHMDGHGRIIIGAGDRHA